MNNNRRNHYRNWIFTLQREWVLLPAPYHVLSSSLTILCIPNIFKGITLFLRLLRMKRAREELYFFEIERFLIFSPIQSLFGIEFFCVLCFQFHIMLTRVIIISSSKTERKPSRYMSNLLKGDHQSFTAGKQAHKKK